MAQIFHPSSNAIARASIIVVVLILGALGAALGGIARSSYVTSVGVALDQPVPFSHQHHVAGVGLDCRYCHTSVEQSAFADIPPMQTCMNCHSQVWADSPTLEPVRESYRQNRPLMWRRVHDLPDFVYFNHSVHVNKGVGCETCHGEVDRMPLTWRVNTLQMDWCLDCHRQPERYLRPRDQVFEMRWRPEIPQSELGPRLAAEYNVESMMDCYTCHR